MSKKGIICLQHFILPAILLDKSFLIFLIWLHNLFIFASFSFLESKVNTMQNTMTNIAQNLGAVDLGTRANTSRIGEHNNIL